MKYIVLVGFWICITEIVHMLAMVEIVGKSTICG
jgi:hypothetical protein